MNCFKTAGNYVSEIDTFLCLFDQSNFNKSQSQQNEIEEYQQLFNQRDNPKIN
ncbi:MAG: CBU_0585 family protein [Rickettsiella sp.]|nr:CBU_0585 family protein [Rickettsiella sp.]